MTDCGKKPEQSDDSKPWNDGSGEIVEIPGMEDLPEFREYPQ